MDDMERQPETLECLIQSNRALAEDILARVRTIRENLFGPMVAEVEPAPKERASGIACTLHEVNGQLHAANKELCELSGRIA